MKRQREQEKANITRHGFVTLVIAVMIASRWLVNWVSRMNAEAE